MGRSLFFGYAEVKRVYQPSATRLDRLADCKQLLKAPKQTAPLGCRRAEARKGKLCGEGPKSSLRVRIARLRKRPPLFSGSATPIQRFPAVLRALPVFPAENPVRNGEWLLRNAVAFFQTAFILLFTAPPLPLSPLHVPSRGGIRSTASVITASTPHPSSAAARSGSLTV